VSELPELTDRRTTSDAIVDVLRDAILTGGFGDGEELNQVGLAKHFGVSRVPIREALRQLQAEGLVSSRAHQRTTVTALSLERVSEILDLRAVLETHLLQLAAPSIGGAELAQLEELCALMDGDQDHATWLDRNRAFHQALYGGSGADFTMELVESLARRIERYLHLATQGGNLERSWEANSEHHAILGRLQAGDVDGACRELRTHIAHTRDHVVAVFATREAEADPGGNQTVDSSLDTPTG